MTPSRARLLFGTDEPVAATTELRAGPLTLGLRAGRLWHLCAGGVEIWHGVAFLYRDRICLAGHFPTTPRIDFSLNFEGAGAGVVRVTAVCVLDARSWRDGTTTGNVWRAIAPPRRAATSRIGLDAYSIARVRLVG